MSTYYGDFTEDDTVNIPFSTFDSNDPSASVTITNLADSDIHVHKDGSITQATTDGATVVINFDGITGNHMITIDTSVDAYYATGSEYSVRIEGTTVDGATINAWVGSFSIERAGGVLALLKGTNSLANIEDKIDIIDVNVDQIETAVITNAAGVDIAADIIAIKAETALIVADTNELQTDDVPTLIAAVQSDTDDIQTRLPAALVGGKMDSDAVAISGDTGAADNLEIIYQDLITGTAQSGANGSITLASAEPFAADILIGATVYVISGTGAGQSRVIHDYGVVADRADIAPNWTTNPDGTSVYVVFPSAPANTSEPASVNVIEVGGVAEDLPTATALAVVDTNVDDIETAVITNAAGTDIAADIIALKAETVLIVADTNELQTDDIPGSLTTLQADTDDIQTRLPTTLVGGAMDSDVSVMQAAAAQTIRDEILPTQNVALSNIPFVFVHSTDHVTPVTGASGISATRSIDGAAFGAITGTVAEVANGSYQLDASAADMNGGIIQFRIVATGGTPGAPDDVFITIVTGGGV